MENHGGGQCSKDLINGLLSPFRHIQSSLENGFRDVGLSTTGSFGVQR